MVSEMTQQTGELDRRSAVASLLEDRGDMLVISGLGSPTWDVFAAGDSDANFYLWGAMGGACMVGLGLAQAQPERKILVVTGDGEQLMGLGGFATIAVAAPKNLTIAVLDNGHYGETGMQLSHAGLGIDLARVAEACNFADTMTATSKADLVAAREQLHRPSNGPRLVVVKISTDTPPRALPPRDAVFLKNRFRANLGFAVN
jgi:thiamine pyrophosphate-dependent acetolactate synthase large subunit-like protein